ncbi:MAG TPA: M48 family metallopeptidase [Opitutaceae bacterium]|jgi:Zn-dependent protease with chaperone function|nr:M48 family metallopeptidase [Opitutaceae bacterium]
MDFFEAQAHAKKRTNRLVVLFVFAVLGTIVAEYFAAIFLVSVAQNRAHPYHGYYDNSNYENDTTPAFSFWQPNIFAGVAFGTLAIVGCASLYKWNLLHEGGEIIAEMAGGRRIEPNSTDLAERRLLDVVEEMAIASGVPMPDVYVLHEEPAINAFAAGLTTSDAVVTVSRGALDKLTRDELQGVVGHEFSHILNGDMRLNLKLTSILFGILVIGLAGRGILWSLRTVRVRGKGGGGIAAIFVIGLVLMIIGYIGYFFGRLIQAAASRQREFLADAASVQFTRNPAGIGGALKKIGGYAVGSSIETHRAIEISHFFFAQAFTSSFATFWATHPPLDARIRAIDSQWDGKFFDPPETVDIAQESFSEITPPLPSASASRPTGAAAAIASIGTLTAAAIAGAQDLLDGLPPRLLAAARNAPEAPALIYGLLLNDDVTVRDQQRGIVAARVEAATLLVLDELTPALDTLDPGHKFSLVQLALPALHQLPPPALASFFDTLDQLIHAHAKVDMFEFALQKILRRNLALGQQPVGMGQQIFSFEALADEISVVLSALAHVSSDDQPAATKAFAAGTGQLKMFEGGLPFLAPDACQIKQLDAALNRLAIASLPIKQRLVTAAAHVVCADGVILVEEAELLRAISAALDVPMPPLSGKS